MKKTVTIMLGVLVSLLVFAVISCEKLDVVGTDSSRAFGELLAAVPQPAAYDAANGGWSLSAPDNSVRFIWSVHTLMMELDAAPFIAAGLDPEKLPNTIIFDEDKIIVGANSGAEQLSNEEDTPLAAYQHIVKLKRQTLGYHGQMDHYGLSLGNGHLFEWAKNMKTNDKDMVFVLEPEPFIAAGVDPDQIDGWVFTKVTIDDENGKPIEVDKILKPFDVQ